MGDEYGVANSAAKPWRGQVAGIISAAAIALFLPMIGFSEPGDLLQVLNNPSPASNDQFAVSVAGLGSAVIVGAYQDDSGAADAGSVYLMSATGEVLFTINNPTPATGDYFGISVAALGANILAGAYLDDTGGTDSGSVYLFDGGTKELLKTFTNPRPEAVDRFGWSIAGLGGSVIVGAFGDDATAQDAGAAYLFDSSTGELLQTFENPDPQIDDQFGFAVTGAGANVIISAPLADAGASDAGIVYVFNAFTGGLAFPIPNPEPAANDQFGDSLASVGGNILVGAMLKDDGLVDSGIAYVFDGATGELLHTFHDPAPETGGNFGTVAGVGFNKAVIGARFRDAGATDSGIAYLFNAISGNLLLTLNNPQPTFADYFGYSVAASGANPVVGAIRDDAGASNAGSAYIFEGISINDALYISNTIPAQVRPLERFGIGVTIRNVGDTLWNSDDPERGYHLAILEDTCGVFEGVTRMSLTSGLVLLPRNQFQFITWVTAPGTEQTCTVKVQMRQDPDQFFGPVTDLMITVVIPANHVQGWEAYE